MEGVQKKSPCQDVDYLTDCSELPDIKLKHLKFQCLSQLVHRANKKGPPPKNSQADECLKQNKLKELEVMNSELTEAFDRAKEGNSLSLEERNPDHPAFASSVGLQKHVEC